MDLGFLLTSQSLMAVAPVFPMPVDADDWPSSLEAAPPVEEEEEEASGTAPPPLRRSI